MKLFVGLGNPGAAYARHRHNVGFMAVDAIAAAHGFGPWRSKFQGVIAEGRLGTERVLLLKPETYMNLSGDAVRAALGFFKLEPADVVAFHDELDLAPGRVRVKTGGGTAGHNGLRSLDAHIGPDFHPRPHRHRPPRRQAAGLAARPRRLRQGRRRLARRPHRRHRRRRAGARRRRRPRLPRRHRPPRRAAGTEARAPRTGTGAPRAAARARPGRRPRPAATAGRPLPVSVRGAFRAQARVCAEMGSPFTARLCALVAERLAPGGAVADRVLGWPGDPSNRADALPLRLAGALHGLVVEGRDPGLAAAYPPHAVDDAALWQAVTAALATHAPFILARLDGPPQTNETQRSAALAPGFLTVAALTGLPLATSEIGASAGLNLLWDRFAYAFGAAAWGDPAAPVRIAPDWQGPPPPLPAAIVAERAGCDRAPPDLATRGRPPAPALLRLGRPARAHGPHRRRDRARPRRRRPRRARRRRRLARRPAWRRRAPATRTSSTTRSSGNTSANRPRIASARASTPPAPAPPPTPRSPGCGWRATGSSPAPPSP